MTAVQTTSHIREADPTPRRVPIHRPVPVVEVDWPATDVPSAAPTGEEFVDAARAAAAALPAATRDAVTGALHDPAGVGAVVVRGVPVGDVGATPDRPCGTTTKDHRSELSLLGAATLCGEPIGYLPEHGGDIVQNILPTAATASRQTSTSSRVTLAFHTETAFHPHRPEVLLLLCLRGDDAAHTTLCCVDDVLPLLSPGARAALHEPRFHTRPDESFGGGDRAPFGRALRVLDGDTAHPTLTYDEELTEGTDPGARAALAELTAAIGTMHTSAVLAAGDLLVVDNTRCVHGRSPFPARYDGTDRWLQRAFVVADLAASAPDRSGRVITTRFAS